MARPLSLRTLRPLRKSVPTVPYKRFARHESTVQIQHVKVRRKFFTFKRFITGALYTSITIYTAVNVFDALGIVVLEDEEEEEEDHEHGREEEGEEGEEEEEDEEEEWEGDEDALFIPLTWAKPMPPTFYKGTDPEWQEYVKFSKDPERMKRVRSEVSDMVWKYVFRSKPFQRRLGEPATGPRRHWLQFIFPDKPPPEYERIGLEFGRGYIAICARSVSEQAHHKLKEILWPVSTFRAVWATGTYITQMQVFKLKQILGIESEPPLPGSPVMQVMQRQAALDTRRRNISGSAPGPSESQRESVIKDLPFAGSPALQTFLGNRTLEKKNSPPIVPRGMIVITGIVEVRGTKGQVTFDTWVHYDPKAAQIADLRMHPRVITPKIQHPKGR